MCKRERSLVMMVVLMWGWGREEEEHCSTTDLSSPATLSGGSLSRLEKPGIFWTNNLPHITYIEQRRAIIGPQFPSTCVSRLVAGHTAGDEVTLTARLADLVLLKLHGRLHDWLKPRYVHVDGLCHQLP
jgi:hypothetical protein